jgi:hypothetical protein
MQHFSTEPSESDLAGFLAAKNRSKGVRREDTSEWLVGRPAGLLVAATFWVSVPFVALLVLLGRKAFVEGLDGLDGVGIVVFCLAWPTMVALFWGLDRVERAPGDFFVLDKLSRVLRLPRERCEYGQNQIIGFVEIQGWHTVVRPQETLHYWLAELTVLVRTGPSEIVRQPVVTSEHLRGVRRCAQDLARFFDVSLRLLKLDRRTRRRLAREAMEKARAAQ